MKDAAVGARNLTQIPVWYNGVYALIPSFNKPDNKLKDALLSLDVDLPKPRSLIKPLYKGDSSVPWFNMLRHLAPPRVVISKY